MSEKMTEQGIEMLHSVTKVNNRLKFLAGLIVNPKIYRDISTILSDPSKLDMTLGTVCYFALFVSALIKRYPDLRLKALQIWRKLLLAYNTIIDKISQITKIPKGLNFLKASIPSEISKLEVSEKSPLMKYAGMFNSMSTYLSDVRMFHRGFSIPGSIADILESTALLKDGDVINFISTICISLYQPFETVAFMYDHNWLFPLIENKNSTWWYVVSTRFWFVWVAVEFLQLGNRIFIKQRGENVTKGELISFTEHLATIPLCMHWSLEDGCLDDLWVGLLGTIAGGLSTMDLWNEFIKQSI